MNRDEGGCERIDFPEARDGVVEVVCGAMLVLGLLTRLAAVPLFADIAVAILSTKLPILLGHGYGPFTLPQLTLM